jgi:hypothetical protein
MRAHLQAHALYASDDPFLPHNANRIARGALETGAIEDAETWAHRAINLCGTIDTQSQARFTHTLATVLLRRYADMPWLAQETFERAQAILAKGVRHPEVEAEIYLDLGRALIAGQQAEIGLKNMEVGLAIAKKKGLHQLADRAHRLLQDAYENAGQKSMALRHQQARVALRRERERRDQRVATSVFAALEDVARMLSRWQANFLDGAPAL